MYLQKLASIQPRTSPVKFARPSGAMRCKNGALNLSGTFETQLTSDMISGERPAWTQKILSSMVAARGSALKTSQKVFHIFTLTNSSSRRMAQTFSVRRPKATNAERLSSERITRAEKRSHSLCLEDLVDPSQLQWICRASH